MLSVPAACTIVSGEDRDRHVSDIDVLIRYYPIRGMLARIELSLCISPNARHQLGPGSCAMSHEYEMRLVSRSTKGSPHSVDSYNTGVSQSRLER